MFLFQGASQLDEKIVNRSGTFDPLKREVHSVSIMKIRFLLHKTRTLYGSEKPIR